MSNPFLPPKPGTVSPLAQGTLGRKLVMRATIVVAVITTILSASTMYASAQVLINALDDHLLSALSKSTRSGPIEIDPEGSGIFRIEVNWNGEIRGVYWPRTDFEIEQIEFVLQLPTHQAMTLDVPGLGAYRVLSDGRIIVGLPFSNVSDPLQRQAVLALLFTLIAIGLSALITRSVVERSMRPLNRLAETATKVSVLPLATGEVAVPIRVAESDTNPASEVGQVGRALNLMLDHVEDALAARQSSEMKVRQFVADASHELRNPLAAIHGYAELTRRDRANVPPDTARALDRIEGESERMSKIVEDLLLLARLDSRPDLDLQPTDITEVVLDAVSAARASGPNHHWSMQLPDDPVIAIADGFRLHQVIANLLANARIHTPAGTSVLTRLHADTNAVLEVIDDGPGVPVEIRNPVFERFSRADVSRARQAGVSSTGLGLAIVKAVITAHHGTVTLDSMPGQTRFTIRIPLEPKKQN